MRKIIYAILCSVMMSGSAFTAEAQTKVKDKDSKENAVWYNARHGDASAMNQVGVWYYTGNKVPKDYAQAYQWWRKAALKQNPKSIANLGVCYQYGRGVEADSIKAIKLYLTAIQNGQQELLEQRLGNVRKSMFDAMLVGTCYAKGIGTEIDYDNAADIFAIAALKGSVDAMRAAGDTYLAAGDNNEAIRYYEKGAAAGDAHSLYMAGKMRLGGMGVAVGKSRAITNIKKAAEAGLPEAQKALGMMYQKGDGVTADAQEAKRWLKAAAQNGDAEAMWLYGITLKNDGDLDEALLWLSIAAQAGYQNEFTNLMTQLSGKDAFASYVRGMSHYYEGDMNSAINEFKNINDKVSKDSKVMEAVIMADPRYAKANESKAFKNLSKLEDSSPAAKFYLANMYLNGTGTDRSISKALSLYNQAADADYGKAQNALGNIYYDGTYTTRNPKAAADLLYKAYKNRRLSDTGLDALIELGDTRVLGYNTDDPVKASLK